MESGPDTFRSGLAISAEDDACGRDRPRVVRELPPATRHVLAITSFTVVLARGYHGDCYACSQQSLS
jgi:hypothetical protein